MTENLTNIIVSGSVDNGTTTEIYDLTLHVPFFDLLIYVILLITAITGFSFLIKLLWK